jgi:hypothetical protein
MCYSVLIDCLPGFLDNTRLNSSKAGLVPAIFLAD